MSDAHRDYAWIILAVALVAVGMIVGGGEAALVLLLVPFPVEGFRVSGGSL